MFGEWATAMNLEESEEVAGIIAGAQFTDDTNPLYLVLQQHHLAIWNLTMLYLNYKECIIWWLVWGKNKTQKTKTKQTNKQANKHHQQQQQQQQNKTKQNKTKQESI